MSCQVVQVFSQPGDELGRNIRALAGELDDRAQVVGRVAGVEAPAAELDAAHAAALVGRRFDTGNPGDYLRTIVQFACERPDIAGEFVPWLRKYLDDLA